MAFVEGPLRISNWILFAGSTASTFGLCGGFGALDFSGCGRTEFSFGGRGLDIAFSTGLCVTMVDFCTAGDLLTAFMLSSIFAGTCIERRLVASSNSFWKLSLSSRGGGCEARRDLPALSSGAGGGGITLPCWITGGLLSVVDDLRKTFGNNEVPFWAPRLNSSEISNDFSRRNTGLERTSALGRSFSGTGARFPITLMTRSVVESSARTDYNHYQYLSW